MSGFSWPLICFARHLAFHVRIASKQTAFYASRGKKDRKKTDRKKEREKETRGRKKESNKETKERKTETKDGDAEKGKIGEMTQRRRMSM